MRQRVRQMRQKTIGVRVGPQSTYKLNLGPIGPTMRPESCKQQKMLTDRRTDGQRRMQ